MTRFSMALAAALAWTGPAAAADPGVAGLMERSTGRSTGRFLARCEDLGGLCFADACGRDQIEAALGCTALCPSSVILDVTPLACPLPGAPPATILRRRG